MTGPINSIMGTAPSSSIQESQKDKPTSPLPFPDFHRKLRFVSASLLSSVDRGRGGSRSFFVCRSGDRQRSSRVPAEALSALDSRKCRLPFSALDLIPLLGKVGPVEPQLTLCQFFDFRFGIDNGGLFNLPYPLRREARSARSWSFVAQPAALLLSVRFFYGPSS
jgi:hypothetical protein